MDAQWAGLFGVLVGGILSWVATVSVERRRDKRAGRGIAIAVASEIESALKLVEARGWMSDFLNAHADAENGKAVILTIHMRDDYLPACKAALENAGVMDRVLLTMVSRLVMLVSGMTSDLQRMANHEPGTHGALIELDNPEQAKRVYSDLINILEACNQVGKMAMGRVNFIYPPAGAEFKIRCMAWIWRLKNGL